MAFPFKRSKYGNRRTDGFDSALEARFYQNYLYPLSLVEKFTIIKQKQFKLELNGIHICDYFADFYVPERNIVFETKGMFTDEGKIKLRLTQALYEPRIIVVRSLSKFEEVPIYRARKPRPISDIGHLLGGNPV